MKVKLLPLTRLFLFQCLLTMIIAMPFSDANAQRRGGHGPGGQGPSQNIDAQINQYLSNGDRIRLNQSLRLNQVLRQGKDIHSLMVLGSSTQYNSKVVLKLNGQKLQAQALGQYNSRVHFQLPKLMMQDKLVLVIKGGAYIQKVSAKVSRGHQGPGSGQGGQLLKAQLMQQFYGPTTLSVGKLIKEQNRVRVKGKKLIKVGLVASSARGGAKAQLLINGMPVGMSKTLPRTAQKIVFTLNQWSPNIIGRDVKSVKIQIRGRSVFVKMVGVKVTGGYGQGPSGRNSVQINVNQRFNGTQRVTLSQLIGYGQRVNMQRPIEAITIVARGNGKILAAGAGRGQGAIMIHGPTTQSLNLMGQHVSGSQLKLRIMGNINIQSIRIKFKSVYY